MTDNALKVTDTAKPLSTHSVLSTKTAPSIPVSGKIRPGIMALTSKYKDNAKAQEIYYQGVANGEPFGVIKTQIMKALNMTSGSPLTPRNVPYFTVRGSDFVDPAQARAIMDMYGEDRGEGRHLYRFPVFFPLDDLDAVMPHALRCFTRSELQYWSDYAPDGTRLCMTRQPVQMASKQKALRTFGGRKTVPREENDGLCAPEECPQFQAKQCNLSGQWVFYVPGLSGAGAISLATNSFYAMEPARQLLLMMLQARGRISGLHNGQALFWFSKQQDEVSMIDPATGKAKKVRQWIIKLSADVDMQQVFVAQDAAQALPAGAAAAAALGGPGQFDDDDDALEFDTETGEVLEGEAEDDQADTQEAAAVDEEKAQIGELREKVMRGLDLIGLTAQQFVPYAAGRWGVDWSTKAGALEKALHDVSLGLDDQDAYRERVTGEGGE